MVTGDGPQRDWAEVVSRREAEPVTLDPYTVELLCGGTCRWCQEKDATIAELRTVLRFHGVEGY